MNEMNGQNEAAHEQSIRHYAHSPSGHYSTRWASRALSMPYVTPQLQCMQRTHNNGYCTSGVHTLIPDPLASLILRFDMLTMGK